MKDWAYYYISGIHIFEASSGSGRWHIMVEKPSLEDAVSEFCQELGDKLDQDHAQAYNRLYKPINRREEKWQSTK